MTTSDQRGELRTVTLRQIAVRKDMQVRDDLDSKTVRKYEEHVKELPALDVFDLDGQLVLVSGFHRRKAIENAAKREMSKPQDGKTLRQWRETREAHLAMYLPGTEVKVRVHQGSEEDARRFAIQANRENALPLKGWDCWRAVWWLDELDTNQGRNPFGRKPSREVAKLIGVSRQTVSMARRRGILRKYADDSVVRCLTEVKVKRILKAAGQDDDETIENLQEKGGKFSVKESAWTPEQWAAAIEREADRSAPAPLTPGANWTNVQVGLLALGGNPAAAVQRMPKSSVQALRLDADRLIGILEKLRDAAEEAAA